MRTDTQIAEAWGPDCHVCKEPLEGERHVERSIVPLEHEVNGCTEYTRVYVVCSSCKEKKELV